MVSIQTLGKDVLAVKSVLLLALKHYAYLVFNEYDNTLLVMIGSASAYFKHVAIRMPQVETILFGVPSL